MIKTYYMRYIGSRLVNKILLLYISIILILLLALSVFISEEISYTLTKNKFESDEIILNNIDNYLNEKVKRTKSLLYQAYIDKQTTGLSPVSTIYSFLEAGSDNLSDEYITTKPVFDRFFNAAFSSDPDITSISVYKYADDKIYRYTKSLNDIIPFEEYKNKEMLNTKTGLLIPETSLYPSRTANYLKFSPTAVYTITLPIVTINPNRNLGVLMIDFDTQGIGRLISMLNHNYNGEILILLKSGEVVYSSDDKYYEKKYPYMYIMAQKRKKVSIEGSNYFSTNITSTDSKMTIISLIAEDTLLKGVRAIQYSIYLASFICILLLILFMILGSKKISKRIRLIIRTMREMQNGNLKQRIVLTSPNDELNEIAISFNKMSEHLEAYIEKELTYELKQKNAELKQKSTELKALQAQINPHFLYNTLEAIRMKAVLDGAEDAGNMIYILSKLFRNLVKGHQVITIKEEIMYCQLYLDLFKIRYGNILTYTIDIDSNILEFYIFKHLLQPLLENYVIHGFNIKSADNRITLKGFQSENELVFIIKDNGKGIDPKTLFEISDSFKKPGKENDSIGLSNVNERIKLIFGETCGLSIQSQDGEGTEVTMKITIMGKEEMMNHVQGAAG